MEGPTIIIEEEQEVEVVELGAPRWWWSSELKMNIYFLGTFFNFFRGGILNLGGFF